MFCSKKFIDIIYEWDLKGFKLRPIFFDLMTIYIKWKILNKLSQTHQNQLQTIGKCASQWRPTIKCERCSTNLWEPREMVNIISEKRHPTTKSQPQVKIFFLTVLGEPQYAIKFSDNKVCKSFLVGCCPHDILATTVSFYIHFSITLHRKKSLLEVLENTQSQFLFW